MVYNGGYASREISLPEPPQEWPQGDDGPVEEDLYPSPLANAVAAAQREGNKVWRIRLGELE